MQLILELILLVLLAATLMQSLRMARALGVLKHDRASLEALVVGFNTDTRQAENGIKRLHAAAEGAGRGFDAQLAASATLKDDLYLLIERGDQFADRLETVLRAARRTAQDRSLELQPAKPMVRERPRERPPVEPPGQDRTQNHRPIWPKAWTFR